jgi:hypothetical protein
MKGMCLLPAGCLLFGACGAADPMTPVASALEDVPVPGSAERNDTLRFVAAGSRAEMSWLSADRRAGYVVPGISSEQLVAWYDEQMPVGTPWQDWAWCERPSQLFQRAYYLPGTNRVLALLMPGGERASVLIVQHEGTGC